MLSNEAVYGFLGCTRRVSDLAPPRHFPSPTAVAPPFLCIMSSSAPLVSFAEPISDPAVFASLLSARAPSFWSSSYRTLPPSSRPASLIITPPPFSFLAP